VSHQFINGELREGTSTEWVPLRDPSTGREFDQVHLADTGDVDCAVRAAKLAGEGWSRTTPAERSGVLSSLSRILAERSEQFAQAESLQAGKPIRLAREFDVPGTIDNVAFFSGAARNLEGKATGEYSADHTSSIRREPVGVIGSIAPWNYPLQMAAWKILPAVAAGNTIVLKPSELTPITALMFAQAAAEAGFPPGVINVVSGKGSLVGNYLVGHPDVDMVSFTGSTEVGTRVVRAAAPSAKRLHMELGGKAPFVVFDDANLEAAAHGAVAAALINTGQDCTAATRAYVQRPLFDQFVGAVADLMGQVRLGPTSDPSTDLGPLVSPQQRRSVAQKVEAARGEGAKVVRGGDVPADPQLANGCYYLPTLITDVAQSADIVQNEVFGPVLVVLPFDSDDDGIRLANDTRYGLAASAWTTNVYRALRATREIRAGVVWINDHIPIISEMPHGGFKQSGYGKDMSQYSLDDYTVVKHIMFDRTEHVRKAWHRTIFALS
jgi:betaine-aldehyde dehydrogenase